ncbi:hypothetical protein QN397_23035 [Variovorax sp. RTB1]|uniref:hypothetical protein n=1 Tax=Variovorax sp. RTB1 TaxID=3048631 RepID=UPI002B238C48|nr:hypothetical protein [Variovorax sp. RTB1]MEB0114162.1 hypothetical protein [Variovorax sp. RTB1]
MNGESWADGDADEAEAEKWQFEPDTIRALGALWHPEDNSDPTPARPSVRKLLGDFTAGAGDFETLFFMRQLAGALLRADEEAPKSSVQDRDAAIRKASGLHGPMGDNGAYTAFLDAFGQQEALRELPEVLDDGTVLPSSWNQSKGIRSYVHLYPNPRKQPIEEVFRLAETYLIKRRKKAL